MNYSCLPMIYFKAIVLEQTLSLFDWLEIASGLAALLAGAGCGVFADIEGARDATIAVTDRTRPDAQRVQHMSESTRYTGTCIQQ